MSDVDANPLAWSISLLSGSMAALPVIDISPLLSSLARDEFEQS